MAYGQIIETFESGSINNWVQSSEGHWKADSTATLSGRYSLHHIFDNPDAGTDQAAIPVRNLHPSEGLTRWSFLVRHGYDPSSSNNWAVFLLSDSEPAGMSPDGNTSGFAVGVNLTGSDDTLRLWKVKGSLVTPVVNCRINWQTAIGISNAVKIVTERTPDGGWTLSVYRLNLTLIGSASGTDKELFNSGWFGVYYKYSSTRDRLLWMDNISIDGNFYEDTEAPVVTGCEPTGKKSVKITLSEEPSADFMLKTNFSLNDKEKNPGSVNQSAPLTYILEFADEFINKSTNVLMINKICDKSGNCTSDTQLTFTPVWAERGDLIISEIMADPLPQVSLPAKGYIEITNRTEYSFNLKNWRVIYDNQNKLFPETIIRPMEIMTLCLLQDTALFTGYGRVTGFKQFPSLSSDDGIICLSDSSGMMIHGVDYSSGWYGDELKSTGGWSLEMIDTHFPFSEKGNWKASSSRKGGTPGTENSVSHDNPDISFYGIRNVFPADSNDIIILFSEPAFSFPQNISTISIGGKSISEIYPSDPLYREFHIRPAVPLLKGVVYKLEISGDIKDFAGNVIEKRSFDFGLTESPDVGDILFNELLFNPLPGDPDYIELFNHSEKILDASRLQLVSVNDATGDLSAVSVVSDEKRCILPGTYYALTTDREKISAGYFSADNEKIFQTGSLPSMADNAGHLILLSRELDRIDEVIYSEKMHYSLLSQYEGISLEKSAPQNSSAAAENWHSASESSGWGTPGAPNSLFSEFQATTDEVAFSSTRITPDNEGFEDILGIQFTLTGTGNVITVTVFDEVGGYIRKVAANMFAGTNALLTWDGTADDGSAVRTGIYVVLISVYDDTGKTKKWKKVCTVVRD